MVNFESDEQAAEALKRWWSENGKSIIAGVILGLALLFGWRGWVEYRDDQRAEASVLYTELQQTAQAGRTDRLHEMTLQLQQDFAGTPYAGQAALHDAQALVEAGRLDEAAVTLSWAAANANEQVIQDLAHLRLARVYVAQGKPDQALAELAFLEAVAYLSLVEEIRGDALRAQGDIVGARAAYDRAILTAGAAAPDYLHMKRDDLGEPES